MHASHRGNRLRVGIFTLNYAPEPIGIGPYSAQMARYLARAGHDVTVIAAKPYYPNWSVPHEWRGGWSRRAEDGVSVIRCPLYVPAKPSGAKRLVHHASFLLSIAIAAVRERLRARFDVVIAVAPSLMAAPAAVLAARSCGAPAWVHVQDFELEAALATGLLGEKGFLARLGAGIERGLFRMFDRASSISPQMCERLVTKGVPADTVIEVRNWSDPEPGIAAAPPDFRERWGLHDKFVALYSGNIANKQGIEIVVEAARLLRDDDRIAFVVCGQGPNREQLVKLADGLDNIQFHDLQPREHLSALLSTADLHLLPQLAEAADLVLPSKLCNMLASGRPVVATAAPGTGIAYEIDGCGISTEPGDPAAFAAAIAALAADPQTRERMGTLARARARERWSSEVILGRLEAALIALTVRPGRGRGGG